MVLHLCLGIRLTILNAFTVIAVSQAPYLQFSCVILLNFTSIHSLALHAGAAVATPLQLKAR